MACPRSHGRGKVLPSLSLCRNLHSVSRMALIKPKSDSVIPWLKTLSYSCLSQSKCQTLTIMGKALHSKLITLLPVNSDLTPPLSGSLTLLHLPGLLAVPGTCQTCCLSAFACAVSFAWDVFLPNIYGVHFCKSLLKETKQIKDPKYFLSLFSALFS